MKTHVFRLTRRKRKKKENKQNSTIKNASVNIVHRYEMSLRIKYEYTKESKINIYAAL